MEVEMHKIMQENLRRVLLKISIQNSETLSRIVLVLVQAADIGHCLYLYYGKNRVPVHWPLWGYDNNDKMK